MFVDFASVERGLRQWAAKRYEAEKQSVLNELPAAYCDKFGSVGFCRGRPVQVLSPFQVPLGSALRAAWMEAFQKVGVSSG